MNPKDALTLVVAMNLLDSSDSDEEIEMVPRRKRRFWTRDWILRRKTEGFCQKLLQELESNDLSLFHNFVRMTLDQFNYLLGKVTPLIKKKDTNMRESITAKERLVLTLRYLATGESFESLKYLFRIPQPTISSIIPEVLDAIYTVLVGDYLQVPKNQEEWESVAQKFNDLWQFPNCIGAVDGKHVTMIAEANSGSTFYNYKGTLSIILMGIADAEYKLLYIDVGRNGRFSDGGVFNRCTFSEALNNGLLRLPPPKPLPGRQLPVPYVLLADDAFALRPNIMKPFSQRGLTMVQRVYNYRLSRGRRIIENVFGIMWARFGVLRTPIRLNAEKAKKVVLACCVLHNYLMSTNKSRYAPPRTFDRYSDTGEIIPGNWRVEETSVETMFRRQQSRTEAISSAHEIQNEFKTYFVEEGELDWQYKHI